MGIISSQTNITYTLNDLDVVETSYPTYNKRKSVLKNYETLLSFYSYYFVTSIKKS